MDGRVEHSGAQMRELEPPPVNEEMPAPFETLSEEVIPTQRVDLGMLELPTEDKIDDVDFQLAAPAEGPPAEASYDPPEGLLPEDMPTVVGGGATPPIDDPTVVPQAQLLSIDELFADDPPEAIIPPALDLASPDLSDIGRFGNSDASAVGEGSLRYNIHVTGIDTADVRSQFREAVTDKKMMWDTEQILRSIKNGEVKLTGMSAVKAYIIVSRLRGLPVEIRWEQYAISQT